MIIGKDKSITNTFLKDREDKFKGLREEKEKEVNTKDENQGKSIGKLVSLKK